jgi:hypothetical protein
MGNAESERSDLGLYHLTLTVEVTAAAAWQRMLSALFTLSRSSVSEASSHIEAQVLTNRSKSFQYLYSPSKRG